MTPLATADYVIEMGALTPELFDQDWSGGDLVTHVNKWIKVSDLHVRQKAPLYYGSTDDLVIANLTMGEVFLVLADLIGQLGARKVYGTHAPIDSEDSESYFGNLEEFYRARAMEFLNDYFVLDDPATGFAAPVLLIGDPVEASDVGTVDEILRTWLDEARGFPNNDVVPVVG